METETKICLSCGKEMDVNAVRCPHCGAVRGRKMPQPNAHIAYAIITMICCCFPCGLVSLIYATQVGKKYEAGDYIGSLKASKTANSWSNWGWFITIVLPVIIFALFYLFTLIASHIPGGEEFVKSTLESIKELSDKVNEAR